MQADSKSYDDINVTPMVDLYLVLLLIFIIMTTAAVQSLRVNLPRAGGPSAKKSDGPKLQAITVDSSGNIKLQGRPVQLPDLESQLIAVKAKTPDFPVVVRGDGGAPYQAVVDVLDAVGRAGVSNVGLATTPSGS